MEQQHTESRRWDVVVALLIFAGIALYLSFLPRNLTAADESIHLYEAKRILNGEVLYRDVYTVYPPASFHVAAWLFELFGTSLLVVRGFHVAEPAVTDNIELNILQSCPICLCSLYVLRALRANPPRIRKPVGKFNRAA